MSDIDLVFAAPLARIRLNAPARRNAISRAMWRRLPEICAAIEAEKDALVVVVEGEGGHFSAGADISEFAEVYRDAASTHEYVEAIQRGLAALAALDRPTIAALSGVAIGGGLGLALCCDLRFCSDDAVLAITPAKLGLLYGFVETRRLVELVGPSRAKDLLFSGRRITPAEALASGLVDQIRACRRVARPCRELCGRTHAAEPTLDPRRQARRRRDRRRAEGGDARVPGGGRGGRARRRFFRRPRRLPGETKGPGFTFRG